MQTAGVRRSMLFTLLLAAAGILGACSEGAVGYEKAAQIEDRINVARSRLAEIDSALAGLADGKTVSDKEINPIREQLRDVRNTLAAIEEAMEPPSRGTTPSQPQPGQPGKPGKPIPPGPAGPPEPSG